MAKTRTSSALSTETLKPYVQRAMTDPELREDLLAAFVAARSIYGQMAKGQGIKGKAEKVSEKDFQKQLQHLVGDLSEASDKLKGNAGKDKIKARGGGKDKVNCGAGKDKAKVDAKDKVSKNCETVK